MIGLALSTVAIVWSRRFLYADSSYFLLGMWESGTFFIPNGARWFGFVASQWMPVLAMAAGVDDPSLLATLFGLNLWINPLLALLGIWWAAGGSREITLAAGAGVLFLFQTTYVVIDNESSVFYWLGAMLVVLTLRRDFAWPVLLLVVPLTFTHEVLVVAFAPIVAVLLWWRRTFLAWYGPSRYRALVSALALASAAVLWRALGPDAGPNRGYFIGGALSLPASPSLDLAALAFASASLTAFLPSTRWLKGAFWASSCALLALPFALPALIWPAYHYRARVLNGLLVFLLFVYLHARARGVLEVRRLLPVRRLAWLVVVVFLFQGKVTWEWSRHMDLFRQRLDTSGIVTFPTEGSFAEPRSTQFSWSWTSPVRSVVFQGMESGRVDALMLNADTTIWQPFDPRDPSALPDLAGVGVTYGEALLEAR